MNEEVKTKKEWITDEQIPWGKLAQWNIFPSNFNAKDLEDLKRGHRSKLLQGGIPYTDKGTGEKKVFDGGLKVQLVKRGEEVTVYPFYQRRYPEFNKIGKTYLKPDERMELQITGRVSHPIDVVTSVPELDDNGHEVMERKFVDRVDEAGKSYQDEIEVPKMKDIQTTCLVAMDKELNKILTMPLRVVERVVPKVYNGTELTEEQRKAIISGSATENIEFVTKNDKKVQFHLLFDPVSEWVKTVSSKELQAWKEAMKPVVKEGESIPVFEALEVSVDNDEMELIKAGRFVEKPGIILKKEQDKDVKFDGYLYYHAPSQTIRASQLAPYETAKIVTQEDLKIVRTQKLNAEGEVKEEKEEKKVTKKQSKGLKV